MTFTPFTIVGTARSFPAQMAEIISRHQPIAVSAAVTGMDSRAVTTECAKCEGNGGWTAEKDFGDGRVTSWWRTCPECKGKGVTA